MEAEKSQKDFNYADSTQSADRHVEMIYHLVHRDFLLISVFCVPQTAVGAWIADANDKHLDTRMSFSTW